MRALAAALVLACAAPLGAQGQPAWRAVDAATGQNGLAQARSFRESVAVTGLALTKLDGTAKGGIVFAVARELGLPIRYIGIGESLEDLRPFDAAEFVEALFEGAAG